MRAAAGDGDGALARGLREAATAIDRGAHVADALSACPGLVTAEEAQMIRAAERVGDLDAAFEGIAEAIATRVAVRRNLIKRLLYPFVLFLFASLIKPFPVYMISGDGVAYVLALLTNLMFVFAPGVGLYLGSRAAIRVPEIGQRLRDMVWRFGVVGRWYHERTWARFTRVTGRNLGSGLEFFESIRIAASVTEDPWTIDRARRVAARVRDGEQLAPAIAACELLPVADCGALSLAEASGELEWAFESLSKRHQEEADRLLGLMAGIVVVFVFLAVGFDILSWIGGEFVVFTGSK